MTQRPSKLGLILLLTLALSSQLEAQSRGKNPKPQLTITSAQANLDTLTLEVRGTNFGDDPSVFMANPLGDLDPLGPVVVDPSGRFLIAPLATTAPGTYMLLVSRGPSTTDVFATDITIGTVGPPGDDGVDGEDGVRSSQQCLCHPRRQS